VAQKKANKIKQKIVNKEKQPPLSDDKMKEKQNEKKLGRGRLQREKKRARKEAGEHDDDRTNEATAPTLKMQKQVDNKAEKQKEMKPKMVKPQKKRKVDKDEDALEDIIRSYKSSFSKGGTLPDKEVLAEESIMAEAKIKSRERVLTKRWFE
jgi:hypothetical protein